MTAREVRVLDGPEAVAQAGADAFVAAFAGVRGERFRVALSGGSTPRAMHHLLATPPLVERIDWSRVEIYFGDERCVPPDHADSNYRMARESLLDRVPIPAEQVHRVHGELAPDEAAREYASVVAGVRLDLVFLGMGPDGHTASLFPGTPVLDEQAATAVTLFVPRLGVHRVTLTAPLLSAAAQVVVMATGAEKADALARALEGPPGAVPIQLIRPLRMLWLVDRTAAAKLRAV
jgi:6-phosphogluconolactonase